MIEINKLIQLLDKSGTDFFTGVPDSVLKELSISLSKKAKNKHIIAVNEGAAVSIGIGYYLSHKKLPCIYMQNSGLSNAINPLISIADKKVYSIPSILLIGWRGSPGKKDEPQHEVKGKITKEILKLLKIKYVILKNNQSLKKFKVLLNSAKKNKFTIAGLIPQGVIKKGSGFIKKNKNKIDKLAVIKKILESSTNNTKIISSTGYNSRELFYLRKIYKFKKGKDFYLVGGMGHTSSITLGYSLNNKKKKIICIDGDGSILMHLGSLKTLSDFSTSNIKYVLMNNYAHDSVGGQPTNSEKINFKLLSKSLGFKSYYKIENSKDLGSLKKIIINKKNCFIEIKVKNSNMKNLPRPQKFLNIKNDFMKK
jgi:phosphonopyruvate decarboxylase